MTGKLTRFYRLVGSSGADKDWRIQFLQHLLTGAIATAAHYFVMWLVLTVGERPILATTAGFTVGATTRFLFSYFHIFERRRSVAVALPRYVSALALQMGLNAALLIFFLSVGLPVWWGQVATTALLTAFNFLMYKHWVFK